MGDAIFEEGGQECVRSDSGRPEPTIRGAGFPRFFEAYEEEALGLLGGEFGEAKGVLHVEDD